MDDPGSTINPPSVPVNLRGVAFSSTTIELEWNESTDDGAVLEYKVYRDDSLIASQSRLRFFDSNLTAGTTHTYGVLAVDDEGNVSDTVVINMTTLDDGAIISEANYSVILPYVVSIANGDLFDDIRTIVDSTDASWLTGSDFNDIAGLTLLEQGDDPTSDLWYMYTYECEFGGSYKYYRDNWIQFGGLFKGDYDACKIGSNSVSGNFNRTATLDKAAPNNELLVSVYNLIVENDVLGSYRKFTGKIDVDNSLIENRLSLIEASYVENGLFWSTIVSNLNIIVYATDEDPLINYALPFNRTFDANFRVQGPQTGDEVLTVDIHFETNDDAHLNYQHGSLTVTAEDGSSLRMDADSSDPENFQLLLLQAQSSTALAVSWSDDYRLKCFHAPAIKARLHACE